MNSKRGASFVIIILIIIILALAGTLAFLIFNNQNKNSNNEYLHAEILKYREELKKSTSSYSDLSSFNYSGSDMLEYIPSMRGKKIDGVDEMYIFSIENGQLVMKNTSKLSNKIEIDVLKAAEPDLKTTAGFYDLNGNLLYVWNELVINGNIEMDGKTITRFKLNEEGILSVLDGIIGIESGALDEESKLKKIELPASIISINEEAFSKCTSLESININSENQYYTSLDGVLYSKELTKIIRYPAGRKGTYIPVRTVTNIGKNAFSGAYELTDITFPDGLIRVSNNAFEGCKKLTEITFPSNVTDVDEASFKNCILLGKITFLGAVSKIGDEAFSNCTRLGDITLNEDLKTIGKAAFKDCISLENILIPQNLQEIQDEAFMGCTSLLSIFIYDKVEKIGQSAFKDCVRLEKVNLSSNITEINDQTFENCKNLNSITISLRVANIGKSAFSNCTSIDSLEIPYSVNKIGENAFKNVKLVKYNGTAIGSPWGAKKTTK